MARLMNAGVRMFWKPLSAAMHVPVSAANIVDTMSPSAAIITSGLPSINGSRSRARAPTSKQSGICMTSVLNVRRGACSGSRAMRHVR